MYIRAFSYLSLALWSGAALAATAQQPRPDTLELVPTDQLIGRDVVTPENEPIGTLRFVTVSLDEGRLSQLVVDPSGTAFEHATPDGSAGVAGSTSGAGGEPSSELSPTAQQQPAEARSSEPSSAPSQPQNDGGLLLVPWSVARVDERTHAIVIAANGHLIADAPRLARGQFNRLTEPAMVSYVVDYWAPASEMAALESQRGQKRLQTRQRPDSAEISKNRQSDRTPLQQRASAATPLPEQTGAAGAEPKNTSASRPMTGRTGAGQPNGGGQPDHVVLVGREVVAEVTPPLFQLSKSLRGAELLDRSGKRLGEIHQIIVDAHSGDAAFAVVDDTPAGRVPVPLQALEWTSDGTTLLDADASKLQADKALTERPDEATAQQLAQLYQRFDTGPSWLPGSSNSPASSGPRSTGSTTEQGERQ